MNLIQQLRDRHRLGTAVKEAFDSLPSAVCYFNPDGSIKLCNIAMYDLFQELAGTDLQNWAELTEAVGNCERTTGVIKEGNIFLFPDGHAWQYSAGEITTSDGRTYIEVIFSDVTELYEKRQELEHQSNDMKKMYGELTALSGQLLEVTREQEILNMKTRLHDQMNMGIAAIRQNLRQNTTSDENAAAIARFHRAIHILQEDTASAQDPLSEFIQDAEVSGVHVNVRGMLPEEGDRQDLLIAVLREACVNAARHADASRMNVESEMTEGTVTLHITNDGKQPEGEIVPRGGLKDLGKRIRDAGGNMEISALPEFMLTVTLPVGRQERGEEGQR